MSITTHDIFIAFTINILAGLATCIGGAVPFSRKLMSNAKPSRVGLALGLSAGVMLFISLVEIFGKSEKEFNKHFGKPSSMCQNLKANCTNSTINYENTLFICERVFNTCQDVLIKTEKDIECDQYCNGHSKSLTTLCFSLGALIIFLLDFIIHKISPNTKHDLTVEELARLNEEGQYGNNTIVIPNEKLQEKMAQESLNRTGILTAIAIGLHNLPEGLATFLATLIDQNAGVALGIGIAIHNIPEGIAVATPIYLATKSKWKGLFYTFLSALFEPLGGLICYIILLLKNAFNDNASKVGELNPFLTGIMFGLVVGMMVTISLKELIPIALEFCKSKDKISISMLIGMLVMALSLIIFAYAGAE
ncbi:hypothetical protein I4U23_021991 [Adineta vaga]|nr:hypothetical protein I4U23_021991 [Adineta vaga]